MTRLGLTLLALAGTVGIAAAAPPLRAGFAEADATPALGGAPVYLAGFGQDRAATGVRDPIMVRTLVLDDGAKRIAVATADVVGLFHPFVERVRGRLTGFDSVLVCATHNHHGPDTMGLWGKRPFSSGVDPAYMRRLEDAIVSAIGEAAARLRPVAASVGVGLHPELLRDARQPVVTHDDLVVLRLDDDAGVPAGLVVQWNCHPETLASGQRLVSADYVGHTVAALRDRLKCPVVYLTGTVGGLMTTMRLRVDGPDGKPLPEGSSEKTERYGLLLADAAAAAVRSAKPARLTPFDLRSRRLLLPVDNAVYRAAWTLGSLPRDAYPWAGDASATPEPLKRLKGEMAVRTEVGVWNLGELSVALFPGEVYPELVLGKIPDPAPPGADFADAPREPPLYNSLPGKYKMIVGLANDEIGYVLPRRQWDERPPYTYGATSPPYGEINSLGSRTAPLLMDAFKRLAEEPVK